MSHETHAHHEHDAKPVVQFKAGIYFVLILAGLFLASIAFVKSMSSDEGGHGAHTEATHGEHEGAAATHEATEEHAAHEAAPATEAHGEAGHEAPAAAPEHAEHH